MNIELVKKVALATNLTPQERGLMLIFCDYANKDGECWPSFNTLSERINLSRRQTIRLVNRLVEKGVLFIKILKPKPKLQTSNLYKINSNLLLLESCKTSQNSENIANLISDTEDTSSGLVVTSKTLEVDSTVTSVSPVLVTSMSPALVTPVSPKVNTIEVNTVEVNVIDIPNGISCSQPSVAERNLDSSNSNNLTHGEKVQHTKNIRNKFEEFWVLYPRKQGKKVCIKKFETVTQKKIKVAEAIISGLRSQLDELSRTEKQFIPLPLTYLTQGRWEDEPPEKESWRL